MERAKPYPTEKIRNVVFLGHGGTGKTTLVDAMAFTAGAIARRGSVADGTALTDFTAEEKAHGISISLALAHVEWMETKLNLIDTPGYLDFTAEAKAGVRVADAAVVTVSGVAGLEVGTEKVWEYAEERALPRLFFLSLVDKENAGFERAFRAVKEHLTPKAVVMTLPIGEGTEFKGIVDLLSGRAHLFDPNSTTGEFREEDAPADLKATVERYRQELFESIAASDDALLEKYLEEGEISPEAAAGALRGALRSGEVCPVFCGSPARGWGVRELMRAVVELLPNPAEVGAETAQTPDGGTVEPRMSDDEPFAALVFKTTSEPHVGELSLFKIVSGKAQTGATVQNATRGGAEKLSHLAVMQGKDRLEVQTLHAGDLGVTSKLRGTHTNDTLCAPERVVVLRPIEFPEPDVAVALRAASRGDEEKISVGLQKMHEEDPTFVWSHDAELGQTIARGLGELHLQVAVERLKRKYGLEVVTELPKIPYRETIRKTAEGQGRYKKQTGGRGQYGDCWVRLSPLPRGAGYEFVDGIVGGVIPNKYIPSVDKGIQEASQRGILAGYPVVDFQAECFDGSHHSVDSSDIAFKVAGSLAFQNVAAQADPVLLEPIYEVEVSTPEETMGDVIGDLNQRRGRILGMEPDGRRQRIRAHVPLAELHNYATALRSITHGRAAHRKKFHSYEEVPAHIAEKIIAEAKSKKAADAS